MVISPDEFVGVQTLYRFTAVIKQIVNTIIILNPEEKLQFNAIFVPEKFCIQNLLVKKCYIICFRGPRITASVIFKYHNRNSSLKEL